MTRGVPDCLFDVRAEESVLGSVFLEPEILSWLELDGRCFYDPRNEAVWKAMKAAAARGHDVDEVTVCQELERVGRLEAVGGIPYVGKLLIAVPSPSNAQAYASILHDRRVARQLWLLGAELSHEAAKGEEGEELLSWLMRRGAEVEIGRDESTATLGEAVRAEMRSVYDHDAGKSDVMLPTGFLAIDTRIGGIPVGQPSLLGALPGTGKSAFALAVSRHVADRTAPVALFTYEDRWGSWAQRALAELAGVSADKIRRRDLSTADIAKLQHAEEALGRVENVTITHAHGWKADKLLRKARALKVTKGVRLFVVDYVQRMPNPDPRQFRKRSEAIGESLRLLSDFAGEEDVAVLVLWQLTREYGKKGGAPTYHDFADSSAAEQYSKFTMALWEPPDDPGERLEVVVLKNSQGPEGAFRLPFDRPYLRIG